MDLDSGDKWVSLQETSKGLLYWGPDSLRHSRTPLVYLRLFFRGQHSLYNTNAKRNTRWLFRGRYVDMLLVPSIAQSICSTAIATP